MYMENKFDCFKPGGLCQDNEGRVIQAHGGGMLYHEGVYYWYGEDKSSGTNNYQVEVTGVHCYSSRDLYNWKDEGLVLSAEETDAEHDLHTSKVAERPKVVFNEKTGKFVMWLHVDTRDYEYSRAGVAVSDSPTGPFTYMYSIKPNENDSRDMTLFKDEDGRAYLVHSSEWNKTLYFSELSEDYLKVTGVYKRVFINCYREAPAIFKHEGRYYIISSGCTGWDPNEAEYAVADSILGEWEVMGNPCIGRDADKTYYSQSAFVFKVMGKENAFIAMFDRWNKEDLGASSYVWLPIYIREGRVTIEWKDAWDLSVFE